jgi:hypothetical protein
MKRVLLVLSMLTLGFTAAPAQAGWYAGADTGLVIMTGGGSGLGYGLDIRVGKSLEIGVGRLALEAKSSYRALFGDDSSHIASGALGARLGLGVGLRPEVFSHVGWGKVVGGSGNSGLTFDVGLALDTSLPLLTLGVHAAFNMLKGDTSTTWFDVGVHGEIGF